MIYLIQRRSRAPWRAALKSSVDFESAFAGVQKTVDATEEEYTALRQSIIDMSRELPISANEIAGVMEMAGQLGIKNENLVDFTRTIHVYGADLWRAALSGRGRGSGYGYMVQL